MTQLIAGLVENVVNTAVSGATPAAATETVLAGSQIVLQRPLKVGDIFQWRISMTKTAAGTGNSAFKVKSNTTVTVAAGTTGGAATVATLTFPTAETAAVGSSIVYIEAVVQKVDPTGGIVFADMQAISTATAATGFSNQLAAAIGTALDTSNDILAVGLTLTSGAADAVTINYCEGRLLG